MMSKVCLSVAAGLLAAVAIGCSGEPGMDGATAEGTSESAVTSGPAAAPVQAPLAAPEATPQAAAPSQAEPSATPEATGTSQDPIITTWGGFGMPFATGFVNPGFWGTGFVNPGFVGTPFLNPGFVGTPFMPGFGAWGVGVPGGWGF